MWSTYPTHHSVSSGSKEHGREEHRTLRSAIMAHGERKWTKVLPLSVRYEQLQSLTVEMVYGKVLKIPVDFFCTYTRHTIRNSVFFYTTYL